MIIYITCANCDGVGHIGLKTCLSCGGSGVVPVVVSDNPFEREDDDD